MLLAIDTATRYLGLALHDGQTVIAEQTWRTNNQHNTLIAETLQLIFSACEVTPAQLTGVAVCIGPGSYTGLRIGVAFAKGIAMTAQLPLIGVSTLDILAAAQPFPNTRYDLLAIAQAGRGRIISATYRVKKGRWMVSDDPHLTTWDELLANREGEFLLTGEINEQGLESITQHKTEKCTLTVVHPAQRLRRAGFLAEEAWQALREHDAHHFPPAQVNPIYLKTDAL